MSQRDDAIDTAAEPLATDGFDPTSASPAKDPSTWTTGDEAMTAAQASYLQTLCTEAGEELDANLTKAAASIRIDELQAITGRGRTH